ncbi:MAG: M56 family metallopeptidase, partial [Planctomycetota bacterium]
MNLSFLPESLVTQIGWLLVHSVWQFTLIVIVVTALLRWLPQSSAAVRYGLSLAGLTAVLLAPAVTWVLLPATAPPPLSVAQRPLASAPVVLDGSSTQGAPIPTSRLVPRDNHQLGEGASDRAPFAAERHSEIDVTPQSASLDSTTSNVATSPAAVPWSTRISTWVSPWLNELVAFWCLGVALFALRPLGSWYVMHRLRTVGVSPVAQPIMAAFDRALKQVVVRRPVRLLGSSMAQVPMVVGYVRPVVLLPLCVVSGLSSQEVEAILAHELAHIRRHDYLVNLLQTMIETVGFYHPAVWRLSSQLRQEREHCCDDLAAEALGNREAYGRALLSLEELRSATPTLALGASDGSLLFRIRRLAAVDHDPPTPALEFIGPMLLFALLTASGIWTASAAQENDRAAPREIASPVEIETGEVAVSQNESIESANAVSEAEPLEESQLDVVHGVLVNAADGSPVRGARVTLRGTRALYAESDETGRFRFEQFTPKSRGLKVWARAGNLVSEKVQVEPSVTDDGESAQFAPLRLEMKPGHQAQFTVVSAESGEPLGDANVKFGYPHRRTITTGADGTALVEGLMPQEYDVTIEADGFARAVSMLNLSGSPKLMQYTT